MTLPARTKYNWLIPLVLLGLLSAFIIFYRFTSVPKTLTFDEIEFAKLALSLDKQPYIPYSPLATGHSTFYFYIILFSMKLFGMSSFGLRLPSALFGVLSVPLFYFILQKCIKKQFWLPFVGTFLFATSRWFFNFARFGFEGTLLLLLELSSLFFFLHYMEHREKKWLIPAGVFAGLAFNSYQPGRLFFIIPLVLIFLYILERKQNRLDFSLFTKGTVTTFLTFLIPFIILITPLSLYLSKNNDVRLNQLMYPMNSELSVGDKLVFFGQNISSTALMFSVKGDVNGRHNYPNKAALNPILSLLFISGFFLTVFDYKKKINQLFLLYFFIALAPTLLTYPWENPNMLRTITCLPAVFYFCTYAISFGFSSLENRFHIHYKTLLIVIFILMMISALYEVRTYYVFQAPVFKEAFEAKMPLQYYIDHPDAKAKQ